MSSFYNSLAHRVRGDLEIRPEELWLPTVGCVTRESIERESIEVKSESRENRERIEASFPL